MARRERREGQALWRIAIIPAALILLAVVAPALHLGQRLIELRAWIASLGPLAPVVYIAIDAVMVPLVMPALAMTIGAAALFGPVLGTVVVVIGSNIGAAFCFLLARYVAREPVERLVSKREDFQRIDRLVTERGAWAVALVRLVPVSPFEIVSYAFGLTGVPFKTYVIWTAIGSLPGAVLYVTGASTILQSLETGRPPVSLAAVFLVVLVTVVLVAMRVARELRL